MRLWIFGDLHMETTRGWDVPPPSLRPDHDLVVIPGDLHVRMERGVKWIGERLTDRPVIYVPGNHEPYGGDLDRTVEKAMTAAEGTNVHVLQDRAVTIGDTVFAGCCGWTDFNLFGDQRRALMVAGERMHAALDIALAASPSLLYWDEVSSLPRRDTLDSRTREFWIPVIDAALKVYDRAQFEGALHLQPEPFEEVAPEKRQNHRLSQKDKEEAVAAVKSGLTPHHVAKRMGVYHTTVAKWVKEFDANGRIRPGGKLEAYADRIVEMIEAGPSRSTYALHAEFIEREQMKVAYSRFSQFIAELGFVRDPQTKCLQRM